MLKTFLPFKAPSEWKFVDPDTGHEYFGYSKAALVTKILQYREQNSLPEIFQLGAVVDNFLCGLPGNIGKCGKNPAIERSWWQSIKGGVVLLVDMVYKQVVSQEEADRRGKICVGCPHNVFPDKGRFVKWSDRIAEVSVPGKKSAYHNQLGNCEVCSCPLKAKIFWGGKLTHTKEELVKFPGFCWQIEGLQSKEG